MKKRKFRYDEGGDVEDMDVPTEPGLGASAAQEPSSFKQAFAQARANAMRGGPKTFNWQGKAYTTDIAPGPQMARQGDMSVMAGMARTQARKAQEGVTPAEFSPASIPKPIGQDTTPRYQSSAMERIGRDVKENLGRIIEAAGPGAAMRAAPAVGRGLGALARAGMEGAKAGRQEAEVARAAERGAASRKAVQAKRAAKETEAADKYQSPEYGYAKGGRTASNRADGIAKRGKTRGTIVMCKGGYKK